MSSLLISNILDGLNEAQKSAVSSPSNVLQVLAPPGSGKTKTLTARVAYLIANNGLNPGSIIVCTFTVKAAREMKERVEKFLGEELAGRLILGTFHSIALRLLLKHGRHIGLDGKFGISDASDSKSTINRIIKDGHLTIKPAVARHRISSLKAEGISAEQHVAQTLRTGTSEQKQEFAQVYTAYEEHLKRSNVLDYDDLLLYCRRLLRARPECLSFVEAVLIDEFQDTNHVQYDLMTLFSESHKNITIVGDPDQSIYGWRSAKIENLHKMQQEYPDTHIVNLEENYRSSACILFAAQEIIEQDTQRHQKSLAPTHSAGERPVLRRLGSAAQEAEWIVSEIQRSMILSGGLLRCSDFAILLRAAFLSRLIEGALGKAGLPYRMVGGHRFYDRVEVKILLDYLRCIEHVKHTEAMLRVMNVPGRHVGETSMQQLLDKANELNVPLWTVVLGVAQGRIRLAKPLNGPAVRGIEQFVNVVLTAQEKLDDEASEDTLVGFMEWLIQKVGLEDYLKQKYDTEEDHQTRWANVQELIVQAAEVSRPKDDSQSVDGNDDGEEQHTSGQSRRQVLSHFLSNIALSTDTKQQQNDGDDGGHITISTMHAAKGLEWPVVFIPAAYNGSIPHSRAEDNDEERRLLYVAMTRAQALLYLSCPSVDSSKGKVTLSTFLDSGPVRSTQMSQGPSFSYDLIRELAKILRRESQALDVEAGRKLLEHHEDNLIPQSRGDGEEGDESDGYDDQINRYVESYGGSKKRASDEHGPPRSAKRYADSKPCIGFISAKSVFVQTTMERAQKANTLTNATSMGGTAAKRSEYSAFTRASTLALEEEKENLLPPRAGSALQPKPSDRVRVTKGKRGKDSGGQRKMTAFFVRPVSSVPQRREAETAEITALQRPGQPRAAEQVGSVRLGHATSVHVTSMDRLATAEAATTRMAPGGRRSYGGRSQVHDGWARRVKRESAPGHDGDTRPG